MKSFSPGGATPTAAPTDRSPRTSGLLGLVDLDLGREGVQAVEHHDVAAVDVVEAVGQLVDEHPVADPQRVLHRPRGDEERLHQERADQAGDGQRSATSRTSSSHDVRRDRSGSARVSSRAGEDGPR